MRFLRKLICKHKHIIHSGTDFVKQADGSWKTVHQWRCKDCGKVLKYL